MKTNERITGPSILSSWIRSICQTVRGYGIDPLPLMERAELASQGPAMRWAACAACGG